MCLILRSFICKKHGERGHGTSKISYQAVPYELFRKGFLIRRSPKNLCFCEPLPDLTVGLKINVRYFSQWEVFA